MKLNLVPTHVSKEKASGGAIFAMFLLIVVGIIGAVLMVVISNQKLAASKAAEEDMLGKASSAKAESDRADALMADSKTHAVVRNVTLAEAMAQHSTVYPDLYDMIRRYVPSYYRVTNMAASPGAEGTCTVTLTGVLATYQQYADLGLAFMRIPGAQSYSPSGYQINDAYVPNLTPDDMVGRKIHPNEGNIPDDELQRLRYRIQQGQLTGYAGAGGYGDNDVTMKGPMPNASLVTLTLTLASDPKHHYDLQTPEPRQTLALGASTAAPSTSGGGAPAGFGSPPSPPPSGNPPAGTSASRKASKADNGD